MPEAQADVLASENIQLLAEQLPSKSDLESLDVKLSARIDSLAARIDSLAARIDSLEAMLESRDARLLLRLAGLLVAIEALFRLI